MRKFTLTIQGMSCGHCVASVKSAIQSVPGTEDVMVDLESASATFSGEDAMVPPVLVAIQEEGYSATVKED